MPVEADFRDVLRLQVPESSFFFILLPPCIYLRISALILEEVFANEHGGYVGSLKMVVFCIITEEMDLLLQVHLVLLYAKVLHRRIPRQKIPDIFFC